MGRALLTQSFREENAATNMDQEQPPSESASASLYMPLHELVGVASADLFISMNRRRVEWAQLLGVIKPDSGQRFIVGEDGLLSFAPATPELDQAVLQAIQEETAGMVIGETRIPAPRPEAMSGKAFRPIYRALDDRPLTIHVAWARAFHQLTWIIGPWSGRYPSPAVVYTALTEARKLHEDDMRLCVSAIQFLKCDVGFGIEKTLHGWLIQALCRLRGLEAGYEICSEDWGIYLRDKLMDHDLGAFQEIQSIKMLLDDLRRSHDERHDLQALARRTSAATIVEEQREIAVNLIVSLANFLQVPHEQLPSQFMKRHTRRARALARAAR